MEKTKDQIIVDLKKDLKLALDQMETAYNSNKGVNAGRDFVVNGYPNIIKTLRERNKI